MQRKGLRKSNQASLPLTIAMLSFHSQRDMIKSFFRLASALPMDCDSKERKYAFVRNGTMFDLHGAEKKAKSSDLHAVPFIEVEQFGDGMCRHSSCQVVYN